MMSLSSRSRRASAVSAALLAGAALAAAPRAARAQTYTALTIQAYGISHNGAYIAGTGPVVSGDSTYYAAIYNTGPGTISTAGTSLAGTGHSAIFYSVNNTGYAVGSASYEFSSTAFGPVASYGTGTHLYPLVSGANEILYIAAFGINDNNVATGEYTAERIANSGVLESPTYTFSDPLGGGPSVFPHLTAITGDVVNGTDVGYCINNSGIIAGIGEYNDPPPSSGIFVIGNAGQPTEWSGGSRDQIPFVTTAPDPENPGTDEFIAGTALGIDSSGDIVGAIQYPISSVNDAYLYTPTGGPGNLGHYSDTAGNYVTVATAIDNGVIVGYAIAPGANGPTYAVIYNSTTHAWQNLNTVYASIIPTGTTLTEATGVDDHGDIVGIQTTGTGVKPEAVTVGHGSGATPAATPIGGSSNKIGFLIKPAA